MSTTKNYRNPEPPKALWQILELCEKGGVTINRAAAVIGVCSASLNRWWLQIKRPSPENVKRIKTAYTILKQEARQKR